MSTFPSTQLKIKSGDGWFAADRSWQSAGVASRGLTLLRRVHPASVRLGSLTVAS